LQSSIYDRDFAWVVSGGLIRYWKVLHRSLYLVPRK